MTGRTCRQQTICAAHQALTVACIGLPTAPGTHPHLRQLCLHPAAVRQRIGAGCALGRQHATHLLRLRSGVVHLALQPAADTPRRFAPSQVTWAHNRSLETCAGHFTTAGVSSMPSRFSLQQGTQTSLSRICMLCWFPHAFLLQGLRSAVQISAGAAPLLEPCRHYGQCISVGALNVHVGCYHGQLACRPGHSPFQLAATCRSCSASSGAGSHQAPCFGHHNLAEVHDVRTDYKNRDQVLTALAGV